MQQFNIFLILQYLLQLQLLTHRDYLVLPYKLHGVFQKYSMGSLSIMM